MGWMSHSTAWDIRNIVTPCKALANQQLSLATGLGDAIFVITFMRDGTWTLTCYPCRLSGQRTEILSEIRGSVRGTVMSLPQEMFFLIAYHVINHFCSTNVFWSENILAQVSIGTNVDLFPLVMQTQNLLSVHLTTVLNKAHRKQIKISCIDIIHLE